MKQLKCWTQVFVKSLGEALEAQGCIFVASDQASSNMFMVHQPRKASAMIISKLHGTQVTPIFVQPTQRCCSSDSFTNLEFRIYEFFSRIFIIFLFNCQTYIEKKPVLDQYSQVSIKRAACLNTYICS